MRFILVFFMLFAPLAQASDIASIQIETPVIFKAFDKARAAGGYMMVSNTGSEDDLLVGIRIEGRMAMIHESREENGVMRMLHVDAIAIPANGMVEFAPGGFHVMIMGLQPGELAVGETVEATLVFDRAGDVPVTFDVVGKDDVHAGHKMTH